MSSTLISVVIPVYNGERFLRQTLESVLSQTYGNLEVIAVNDGSTDQTARILEQWAEADRRLRVVTTENRGLALARNLGIETGSGEYLAFTDADDVWHPDKLTRQMRLMCRAGETFGFVYAYSRHIDEEGNWLGDGLSLPIDGFAFEPHLLVNFVGSGSNILCRRDLVRQVGMFRDMIGNGEVGGCEDYDLQLELAARFAVGVVPEFLVGYRRYPGAMSTQAIRMAASRRSVVERHLGKAYVSERCRRWAKASLDVVEIGALVRARSSAAAAMALCRLAWSDAIRLWSEIPWRFRAAVAVPGSGAPTSRTVAFGELDPTLRLSPPEPNILSPVTYRRLLELHRPMRPPRRGVLPKLDHLCRAVRGFGWLGVPKFLTMFLLERLGVAPKTYRLRPRHARRPLLVRGGTSDFDVMDQVFCGAYEAVTAGQSSVNLVVDCGANVGFSTVYFLEQFKGCRVIAIEPDPDNYRLLIENTKAYGNRVTALQSALWSHRTRLTIDGEDYRDGRAWSRQVIAAKNDDPFAFEAIDIPSILKAVDGGPIDILKIDIEGAEAVIFGDKRPGAHAWLGDVRNIAIELHDDTAFGPATELFEEATRTVSGMRLTSGDLTIIRDLRVE